MNSSRFIAFLATIWCLNNAAETEARMQNALFFDWRKRELVEVNKFDEKTEFSNLITACPIDSDSKEKEKLLNDHASITRNGVFLRKVYTTKTLAKDVEMEICENAPTPTLTWDRYLEHYEIGYELFHEQGTIDELGDIWYEEFAKVTDGVPSKAARELPNEDLIIVDEKSSSVKFQIVQDPEIKMVLYWIEVLKVKINSTESTSRRLISFKNDRINDYFQKIRTIYYCQFYYSGDGREVFDKKNEDDDQDAILIARKKPDPVANRLVKTQIIPMLMFHTRTARLATCMYLNFAFVWETIAKKQLKTIDLFVYSMYRLWPSNIYLQFGVNGEPNKLYKDDSEDELFRKFPIPDTIYRIINYSLNKRLYSAVIVIHNDPNPIKDTERKCDAKLQDWEDIEYPGGTTGTSYACPVTWQVMQKLGYDKNEFIPEGEPLELSKFPTIRNGQIHEIDVRTEIRAQRDYFKKKKMID